MESKKKKRGRKQAKETVTGRKKDVTKHGDERGYRVDGERRVISADRDGVICEGADSR